MNGVLLFLLILAIGFPAVFGIAWAVIRFGIKPKIEVSNRLRSNARNTITKITIRPDLGGDTVPILAQEIAEQEWTRSTPWRMFLKTKKMKRAVEFWGKEIEVQAAVILNGIDEDERRASEAASLHKSRSYPQFRGWSLEDITVGLVTNAEEATEWFVENRSRIEALARDAGLTM